MVPRVTERPETAKKPEAKRFRRLVSAVTIVLFFAGIVGFKIFSYVDPSAMIPSAIGSTFSRVIGNGSSFIGNLPFLNNCPAGLAMHDVPGGYVCAPGAAGGVYEQIYQTYPLVGSGREAIYASTDGGSVTAANDLLENVYDVPRYAPLKLSGLPTWTEDPYSAKYWRFEFYSLRPSLNLLYAFRTTGNPRYAQQIVALDSSFIAAEPKSKSAWSDPHAVAFRAMSLVDTWWKLRQAHQLSEADSTLMLGEIEKTGAFLANPNHYQAQDNHAVNEAAALYEIAVAFPALPNAQQWLTLADQRFQWQLGGLIDADGQLIENSPYYDFYILEKYQQIYQYALARHAPLPSSFKATLESMTKFATYILQPNSQVPLLGASIKTTIHDNGVYRQLAAMNPQLEYVLTHGGAGTVPAQDSIYFPASALTVMRSGWPSGAAYPDSTYLTYNVGKYRTAHSDLDALAITLYGKGGVLLPAAGLDTYTPGPDHSYFHGTAAENTVAVDGRSQHQGNGTATALQTVDGITYQSAESSLYAGVTHQRMVMMIDADHILVVDRLSSAAVHDYQQMFHLFPGAKLTRSGLTVTGTGGTPQRQVTIQQVLPQGITASAVINRRGANPAGLCSQQYGQLLPCYQIAYSARGTSAEFVTLITVGPPHAPAMSVTAGGQRLTITQGQRRIAVDLGQTAATPSVARATDPVPPKVRVQAVPASTATANWAASGPATLSFAPGPARGNAPVAQLTTSSSSRSYLRNDAVRLNLLRDNAKLAIRIAGYARLGDARLILSSGHWAKTATMNLLQAVPRSQSGSWTSLLLAPGGQWGSGGWQTSPGFDWSHVDGLEIETAARASAEEPGTVSIGGLGLLPAQSEGKVVIAFDGGSESILPAASYLHENGMPANVGVVGRYVDYPTLDHLNVYQLRQLQDDWGWNLVNSTQTDADAVAQYYDKNNLSGYQTDILQQAAWLEANGLNSAPNWFIYPHGAANSALESVVSRYYMYARGTADNPEAYSYGDPHDISDLQVEFPGDGGKTGGAGLTSPAEIASAVHQAAIYHTTLILTFPSIHALPSDQPGYPLSMFKQVVNNIRQSGIKVMTFSQLDESNGVPVTNRIYYQPAKPAQLIVQLSVRPGTVSAASWTALIGWLVGGILLLLALLAFALWMRAHQGSPAAAHPVSAPAPARAVAPVNRGCAAGRGSPGARVPDHYDQQVLSLCPVLYLPLGGRPSSAADLSGHQHRVSYESAGRPLGTARLPNGDPATVFDGNGQYVQVPSFKALSVTGTGALTVQAWIRPAVLQFPHEEGSGYVYILGKGTSGRQEYAMRMYSYANSEVPPRPNRISAYAFNLAGGLGSGAYFQDKVLPGEWIMITFVLDSRPSAAWPDGYISIYRNGVPSGGPVSLGQFNVVPQSADAPFRIGTRDLNSFFAGAIGKVAVYDSVLSDREILATYQAMVSASPAPASPASASPASVSAVSASPVSASAGGRHRRAAQV